MAKLVVEVDTKEETMTVTINGKPISDVASVRVSGPCCGGTKPYFTVEQVMENEEEEMYTYQTTSASETNPDLEDKVVVASEFDDVIKVKGNSLKKLSEELGKFLGF